MEIKKVNSYEIDGKKFESHEEAKRYVMKGIIKDIIVKVMSDTPIISVPSVIAEKWGEITAEVDARRKELFPRNRKGKES